MWKIKRENEEEQNSFGNHKLHVLSLNEFIINYYLLNELIFSLFSNRTYTQSSISSLGIEVMPPLQKTIIYYKSKNKD